MTVPAFRALSVLTAQQRAHCLYCRWGLGGGSKDSLRLIFACLQVLGARHLPKNGRGIVCPFVELEVAGAEYDSAKQKTEFVGESPYPPLPFQGP